MGINDKNFREKSKPSLLRCVMVISMVWLAAATATAMSDASKTFILDTRTYAESTGLFEVDTRGPDVIVNTGIDTPGGSLFVIRMAMLRVTSGLDGMDAITFTLLTAPVHGTLRLDGTEVTVGVMFTQGDVDAGLLTYERDPGEARTDTFELGAVDEAGRGLVNPTTLIFAVKGIGGVSGMPFSLDTRNFAESAPHVVHTDTRAYLSAAAGLGSLRQALANGPPNGADVDFDAILSGRTIRLNDELAVSIHVGIDATALPRGITIDAGPARNRIFNVGNGKRCQLMGLTLTGGDVGAGQGGAIFAAASSELTLSGCTLNGNVASEGGGIYSLGSLVLENCTLAGNNSSVGGAIQSLDTCKIAYSTLTGNFARRGSGIYGANASLRLVNTIVAGNFMEVGGSDVETENAVLIYDRANIVQVVRSDPASSITGPAPIDADPRLAPLGDYGGSTATMPPLPGSPAIEAALQPTGTPPPDQRGNPRPNGPLPDIGAVEAGSLLVGDPRDADRDGIPDILEGRDGPYPHLTVGTDDSRVDTDGDGSSDAEEIGNMTNLFDARDFFRLTGIGLAAGFDPARNPLVTVTVTTFPGLEYEFETSADLDNFRTDRSLRFVADDFVTTFELRLATDSGFVRARRK